jgi:hypothetical protein
VTATAGSPAATAPPPGAKATTSTPGPADPPSSPTINLVRGTRRVMAPTSTTTSTIAREYLRVSVDKSGRERSPEEQHADNERAAADHRWALGDPYRDVGSASRYATGTSRPRL